MQCIVLPNATVGLPADAPQNNRDSAVYCQLISSENDYESEQYE
jgi:hypothetical protein